MCDERNPRDDHKKEEDCFSFLCLVLQFNLPGMNDAGTIRAILALSHEHEWKTI
jgi:hypothetical protein